MLKQEYLKQLKKSLSPLPRAEINERVNFYSEMIDDLIEEGLSENEATAKIGSIADISRQILTDFDPKSANESAKKLSGFDIAIMIIGAPVWLPLLVAAAAIILSFYIIIWSLILTVWAVEAPFYIFAFISKYLLIFCIKATKCTASFTKSSFERLLGLIQGDKK